MGICMAPEPDPTLDPVPPYSEKETELILKNYEVKLDKGPITCTGKGLEPFKSIPEPDHLYLLYEGKIIYSITGRIGSIPYFKTLLSLRVRSGNYDVKIIITHLPVLPDTHPTTHEIHLKMDRSNYEYLIGIIDYIYKITHRYCHYHTVLMQRHDSIRCEATIN